MKYLIIFISVIFIHLATYSQQVVKVSIQASGLTCSMCSNAINKALKTVDFVQFVNADVQTSTFEIHFKKGSEVDFDKLKKKVEDAGFFVSSFIATINFHQVPLTDKVMIGDKAFHFVGLSETVLNGEKQVKILNKGFISSKEAKKLPVPASVQPKVYYATI